jgi:hypothetical protein
VLWIRDVYPGSATLQKKQDVTRLTNHFLNMDPYSFLEFGSMYEKRLVKGPKPLETGTAILIYDLKDSGSGILHPVSLI